MAPSTDQQLDQLPKTFGLWSGISVGWLTINSFGGMSFILFVGLSAGGIPTILYGFIASSACALCIMLVFAQCAARFSTAGGAYHYATFLAPVKYRRSCGYFLGWLNYLGWVFTHAACCAIVATLTLALINLCKPEFDVTVRWQMFLLYLAVATICWLINLFGLKGIPTLEVIGCWFTVAGFVIYTIVLLVKAPKATARSVFVQTSNNTGYDSTAFAVLLGLFNSFSTLMGLDGPAHLAEEMPQPKRVLPRVMIIVIISQAVIGVIWIVVLGFSITDLSVIVSTTTGVPVLELIRQGVGSDAAAIGFCILLIINNGTSALGSAIMMSRQGYAFARDGGLFCNTRLTTLTGVSHMPVWSICVPSAIVALIGIVYLFSQAAFNAIIGSQAVCMIVSFGFPALLLLVTRRSTLPFDRRWNFGVWSDIIYTVSVLYAILVTLVAFMPQVHPVTSLTMNYTILIIGVFGIAGTAGWWFVGREHFTAPVDEEEIAVISGINVTSHDFSDRAEAVSATKDMQIKNG